MKPELRTFSQLPIDTQEAIKQGTRKTVCPVCCGGKSRELSLGVYPMLLDADIPATQLTCFRLNCSWRCLVIDSTAQVPRTALKPGRPYQGSAYRLTETTRTMLADRYNLVLGPKFCRWRETDTPHELLFEIRGDACELRGHVTRNMRDKQVRAYKQTARPWLDYWLIDQSRPMVIVEDSISAARLYQCDFNAVALQGTRLTPEAVAEIRAVKASAYYIALDRDATDKAMAYAKRYSYIFQPLHLTCLSRDIKDMRTDAEIKALFRQEQGTCE